jgi:hypothetical protein
LRKRRYWSGDQSLLLAFGCDVDIVAVNCVDARQGVLNTTAAGRKYCVEKRLASPRMLQGPVNPVMLCLHVRKRRGFDVSNQQKPGDADRGSSTFGRCCSELGWMR